MAQPVLNSMLLGSTDPERLKAWYRDGFHAEVDGYGNLNLGGFGLVIEHRDDVAATNTEPGRFIVNFADPEDRGVGWFATLIDPDGNYVQLIQMKPEYYAIR